jgi:hypothetical protein
MIDNRDHVDRLLDKLKKSLPIPARVPPDLMASLRRQNPDAKITADCEVAKVFYSGDKGGVLCHVRFDKEEEKKEVFLVSLTYLAFDPRLPVAHDIAAYQKHRIKRLRRDAAAERLAVPH